MVAFTLSEQPIMPLLGHRGFFDNYQIRFQRYKDRLEIYPKSITFLEVYDGVLQLPH